MTTDVSDASRTLLLDVRRREWSAEILEAFEFDAAWLPDVRESATIAGRLRSEAADELGLAGGLLVAAGAGDK